MFKKHIKKLQGLPEEKRRAIFGLTMIFFLALLLALWLRGAIKSLVDFNFQNVPGEFNLQSEEYNRMLKKQEDFKQNLQKSQAQQQKLDNMVDQFSSATSSPAAQQELQKELEKAFTNP